MSATQPTPGNWNLEGPGVVEVRGYGDLSGNAEMKLECLSATTDRVSGVWNGQNGRDELTGELAIGSGVAVENGTWQGAGVRGYERGSWHGEFKPTAPSGGTVPGTVEVETSPGTLVNSFTTEAATQLPLLPAGDAAPVGGVAYAVQVPSGATISVKLTLPPGSNPTGLLKLINGSYVEVPSTIVGETIQYELTDGGPFDEDKKANGEIIDPVVPVGGLPAVKKLSPKKGPLAGGTSVTITGSNLLGATGVEFGSVPAASFKVNSPSSITAVSPAGAKGAVDVTVTTHNGTSAKGKKDRFKYMH